MRLTCPGCEREISVPDEGPGTLVRCPICNDKFSSRWLDVADDDDPLSIRLRPRKKRGNLLAVLFGGGALFAVIIAVCGGSLVVLFAFLMFIAKAGDDDDDDDDPQLAAKKVHDLLSLAPADSLFLFGMTAAEGKPLPPELLKLLNTMNAPVGLEDLFADAERLMIAVEFSRAFPTFLAVIVTKHPYDQEKVKTVLELGPQRKVQGMAFHEAKPINGPVAVLSLRAAMPNPRMLIVSMMPEDEFVKALANRNKPPLLKADLLEKSRKIEKFSAWAVLANEGIDKLNLVDDFNRFLPLIADGLLLLKQSRNMSLVVDPDKDGYRCELSADYADAAIAKGLKVFVDASWKGLPFLAFKAVIGQNRKTDLFVQDLERTFKLEQREAVVTVTFVISAKAIEKLE